MREASSIFFVYLEHPIVFFHERERKLQTIYKGVLNHEALVVGAVLLNLGQAKSLCTLVVGVQFRRSKLSIILKEG